MEIAACNHPTDAIVFDEEIIYCAICNATLNTQTTQ